MYAYAGDAMGEGGFPFLDSFSPLVLVTNVNFGFPIILFCLSDNGHEDKQRV